jgi:hypothetical protein
MFDIVGDVHGNADLLVVLLQKLNYLDNQENIIQNPEKRQLIFCGDLINRGKNTPRVLEIAKSLYDSNQVIVMPGNHEFFSLFYHFYGKEEFIKPFISKKAILFFEHTNIQFLGKESEWEKYMDWFMELPLFFENDELRVIHALWHDAYIDEIKQKFPVPTVGKIIKEIVDHQNLDLLYKINILLRGKEIKFEKEERQSLGLYYAKMRTKWWLPDGEYALDEYFMNVPPKSKELLKTRFLKHQTKHHGNLPVFFGHYSMETKPYLISPQFCCLDFGIANSGPLIAYQFKGEGNLTAENMIVIDRCALV